MWRSSSDSETEFEANRAVATNWQDNNSFGRSIASLYHHPLSMC